jgi:polyhydroxybutyrate depolymerase
MRKFILVLPEGKLEPRVLREGSERPNQFWNANQSCCDLRTAEEKEARPVDDVKYLTELTELVLQRYHADKKRVYLYGHSNGAMMAHRLACEKSPLFAAIAAFAGGTLGEDENCPATEPLSVLQIHGTSDELIPYNGAVTDGFGYYPGGWQTAHRWAAINGCENSVQMQKNISLDLATAGRETSRFSWNKCVGHSEVALWSIVGGVHVPPLSPTFSHHVLDWLFQHSKKN